MLLLFLIRQDSGPCFLDFLLPILLFSSSFLFFVLLGGRLCPTFLTVIYPYITFCVRGKVMSWTLSYYAGLDDTGITFGPVEGMLHGI